MGGCQCRDSTPSSFTASNHGGISSPAKNPSPATSSLDAIDQKLKYFKTPFPAETNIHNAAELYLHIGGNSLSSRWIISEKLAPCNFFKPSSSPNDDNSPHDCTDDVVDNEEEQVHECSASSWFLQIGSKVRVRVGPEMLMKAFPDQWRVDFVAANEVWAIKFSSLQAYTNFQNYHRCLSENAYGFEANEENKVKVFGKDFMPDSVDDSIWEGVSENFEKR